MAAYTTQTLSSELSKGRMAPHGGILKRQAILYLDDHTQALVDESFYVAQGTRLWVLQVKSLGPNAIDKVTRHHVLADVVAELNQYEGNEHGTGKSI